MLLDTVAADLAGGLLVRVVVEDAPWPDYTLPPSAVCRCDSPPGPTGRWLIDNLSGRLAAKA
jgi:hypothetical protein